MGRRGAPRLVLEAVSRQKTAGGWQITGRVLQEQARPYQLRVALQVNTVLGL